MSVSIFGSPHLLIGRNSLSLIIASPSLSLTLLSIPTRTCSRSFALKSGNDLGSSTSGETVDPVLLRKPLISNHSSSQRSVPNENAEFSEQSEQEENGSSKKEIGNEWVDWEDQILEDTVPLVGFVRMILHSGKYDSGDRLSAEHEKTILERILPYHPEADKKIGCGVDYITIGYHPDFEKSRCLFIVRKDGEMVDFSYWKCIKGLIKKNYPLYADTFILRHFRRRRHGV